MSRTVPSLPALLLIACLPMAAQQPAELTPQQVDLWHHRLGPEQAVHLTASDLAGTRFIGMEYVEFNVIVSANGRPESATPTTGKAHMSAVSPHLDEAQAIVLARSYKPWVIDGVPTRVKIQDYVSLLPPEKYGPSVPFPDVTDLSTVSIGLSRTPCFGSCPAYELTLAGDGTLHFSGHSSVLIPGDHTAHISPDKVRELLTLFRKADFFSANNVYRGNWTDNPTQKVSLTIGPLSKTVTDYVGTDVGLPLAIRNLEAQIDEAADTARWVATDEATLPSLRAEKWPFSAATEQNLTLYNTVIAVAPGQSRAPVNTQLLEQFLAAKAPVISAIQKVPSPICVASSGGDLALVRRMAGVVKSFPPLVLSQCLMNAAGAGSAAVFQFWLDRGAVLKSTAPVLDRNGYPGPTLLTNAIAGGDLTIVRRILDVGADLSSPQKDTPLLSWTIAASRSNQLPELIAMLVAAGADPNARDWMGQTPLITNNFRPDLVKPLLAAGAKLEERDKNGRTALIAHAFYEPMVKELLAAGADPAPADARGNTALSTAHQFSCEPCAQLIQQALDKRKTAGNRSTPAAPVD